MTLIEALRRGSLFAALAVFSQSIAVKTLAAQTHDATAVDFSAGSEYENYLRALQTSGIIKGGLWSIRAFSERQISEMAAEDTAGPWRLNSSYVPAARMTPGSAKLQTIYNSKYPYGSNDGPLWAGRAFTFAASGGISGKSGPVSYEFAPMIFWARNRWWRILDNGKTGNQQFNHGTFSGAVDYPQRFGNDPYFRIDPGQSSIRLDRKAVTLGFSTANEWIGPATEYPFLLSNNAAGFPHIFLGTGDPANIWIAHVHARAM